MPDLVSLAAILLYLTAKGVYAFWLSDAASAHRPGRG